MPNFDVVVTEGTFYTDPSKRYASGAVACDRCQRRMLTKFYGKDDVDVCLKCASMILASIDEPSKSKIERTPAPNYGIETLMMQSALTPSETSEPRLMAELFKPFPTAPPRVRPTFQARPGWGAVTRMMQQAFIPQSTSTVSEAEEERNEPDDDENLTFMVQGMFE